MYTEIEQLMLTSLSSYSLDLTNNEMILFKKKQQIMQSNNRKYMLMVPIADYAKLNLSEEVIQAVGMYQLVQWATHVPDQRLYLTHQITVV